MKKKKGCSPTTGPQLHAVMNHRHNFQLRIPTHRGSRLTFLMRDSSFSSNQLTVGADFLTFLTRGSSSLKSSLSGFFLFWAGVDLAFLAGVETRDLLALGSVTGASSPSSLLSLWTDISSSVSSLELYSGFFGVALRRALTSLFGKTSPF